jgi:uncharacterized membrane-anchored protein
MPVHIRLWVILFIGGISTAAAQDTSTQTADIQRTYEAAVKAATSGPADVPLRELATIHLPDPYSFIPVTEGAAFMRAMGNATDENFYGLVLPKKSDQFWFVTIDYVDSGHLKDDDAKSWNADELLKNVKDGTEANNKERVERGFPPLEVVGWIERPSYDESTHRLVWSMLARDQGSAEQMATVNYNTYALGRQGYFSLNLVTGETTIAADKKHAGAILAGLDYKPGERYADFNSSTDRVAEYGLAALIGGIAAMKLGFLALIGVTFAKFWKLILIAVAVAGGGFRKLFRRKNTTPQA